jgi:hypothetical protein
MTIQSKETEVLISRKFNLCFINVEHAIKSNLKESENQIIIGTNSARELVRFLSYLTGGDWFKANKDKIFFQSTSKEMPCERISMTDERALKNIRNYLNDEHLKTHGTSLRSRERARDAANKEKRWKEL